MLKNKERIPTQLNKKNLQVNKTKTEEYTIKRNGQQIGKDVNIWLPITYRRRHKEKKNFSNSSLHQTGKQVNINENKNKNSKSLHEKCLPIQFRIVDLDQTNCKENWYLSKSGIQENLQHTLARQNHKCGTL